MRVENRLTQNPAGLELHPLKSRAFPGALFRQNRKEGTVGTICSDASGCANGTVSVLPSNRDGTFQTAVSYGTGGTYALSVAMADVNGERQARHRGGERVWQQHQL
jgi:hypothetical protein